MFRFRTAAIAAAAAIALVGASALPADAGPNTPNRGRYAALGDSFAAGVGLQLIQDSGASLRSSEAYPVVLADKVNKVTFLASSGATTTTVLEQQVSQIPPSVQQVTITVGGNDIDFGTVAEACRVGLAPGATTDEQKACFAAVGTATDEEAAKAAVLAMANNLAALIDAIQERAPRAEIYVTGYPLLFQCDDAGLFDAVDFAVGQLNTAIAGVAEAEEATYVDVTGEFEHHGFCSNESWIQGLEGEAPLHPTVEGQQAYAEALEDAGVHSAR